MAIKGQGYIKTAWDFEERPVASAKLNQWDDRIEAALELVFFLLSQAWGGGNGVLRGASAADLQVAAKPIPAMAVDIAPGYAFVNGYPYRLAETLESTPIEAPASLDRIDVVAASLTTGGVLVVLGVESGSPGAPAVPADHLALARLYLRPGMTAIKNLDDASNGYIIDRRVFL